MLITKWVIWFPVVLLWQIAPLTKARSARKSLFLILLLMVWIILTKWRILFCWAIIPTSSDHLSPPNRLVTKLLLRTTIIKFTKLIKGSGLIRARFIQIIFPPGNSQELIKFSERDLVRCSYKIKNLPTYFKLHRMLTTMMVIIIYNQLTTTTSTVRSSMRGLIWVIQAAAAADSARQIISN